MYSRLTTITDLSEPWNEKREKYFFFEMTTKKILSNDEKNTLGYGRNVTVERLERDKKKPFLLTWGTRNF